MALKKYTFYKIENAKYVGATTNWLSRKREHRNCVNNEKSANYKHQLYVYCREQDIEPQDLQFVILDTQTYETKVEAKRRELELILEHDTYENGNNMCLPFVTEHAYKTLEYAAEYQRYYQKLYRDKHITNGRASYQKHKEKRKAEANAYYYANKAMVKARYERNKVEILAAAKIRYQEMKIALKEKNATGLK